MRNLDFFLLFLLAHLTGNFVLQTGQIARLKAASVKGVAVHAFIVSAVQAAMLSLYGTDGLAAGIIAGAAHFIIDCVKLKLGKRFVRLQFIYFTIDQAIHIAVILLISLSLSSIDQDKTTAGYVIPAIGFVLLTFAATVASKTLVRDIFPVLKKEVFFKRCERLADAFALLLSWTACQLPLPWNILSCAALGILYLVFQRVAFKYDYRVVFIKYLFYTAAAVSTALLVSAAAVQNLF